MMFNIVNLSSGCFFFGDDLSNHTPVPFTDNVMRFLSLDGQSKGFEEDQSVKTQEMVMDLKV